MNKKNKILVGCLALLLVLSVGYALFSETVTINGTATAKGNFDITASCSTGASEYSKVVFNKMNPDFTTVEGGFSNDSCSVDGSEVSFEADLSMPTAARYFTIRLKNTGTIPAKFNLDENYSFSYSACVDKDGDDIAESCLVSGVDTIDDELVLIHPVGASKADGTEFLFGDTNLETEFIDPNNSKTVILEPQESVIVLGVIQWPEHEEANNILFTITGTSKFTFTQATN